MGTHGADRALARTQTESDSPYTFRELFKDVPLTSEDTAETPYITAVDYWDGNLYIGGSHGELLHFVSIPAEDDAGQPTFILASRLEPEFTPLPEEERSLGVQQILLLPSIRRACVRCNNTLTFYTLPELSPAYGGKIKQGDCHWVGGLDEDHTYEDGEEPIIILCLKQRLRLIRVGEQARKVRDIEIPGCVNVRRRGNLACVADEKSYSLIDVVNQQKIDLFPVATAPPPPPRERTPSPQPRPRLPPGVDQARPRPVSMHFPNHSPVRGERRGHERISSLGAQPRNTDRLAPESPSNWPSRRSSRGFSPGPDLAHSPLRTPSPLGIEVSDASAADDAVPEIKPPAVNVTPLQPHIISPTTDEFLLTTGTVGKEPGVGMFVNQEGDVSRGTLDISSYPSSVLLEVFGDDTGQEAGNTLSDDAESVLFALITEGVSSGSIIELQSLESEAQPTKTYLTLPTFNCEAPLPLLFQSTTDVTISTPKIIHMLGLRPLKLTANRARRATTDETRIQQEDRVMERFAKTKTQSILFGGTSIWWIVRQPVLLKLDAKLEAALTRTPQTGLLVVNRSEVQSVFNHLRGREAHDEIHFMTFNYVRQKAAILLLLDLLVQTAHRSTAAEKDLHYTQEALISSELEPRVVLALIPALKGEVVEGGDGVWVPGGLRSLIDLIRENKQLEGLSHDSDAVYWNNILPLVKGYLSAWRKKKGFGSIADEAHVFQTVDAALLHVLLILDQRSPSGPASQGSLRSELNEVVDNGVDCFDRAVLLLESFHRLYILSRLYQNKKIIPQVLATWRRILEGEDDRGGELVDGESHIRKYLTRIKDADLVKEYGTWLANRNPSLGVQIFADDSSRVKFTTTEAVDLLKAQAPNAVKHYLEYLVFTKNQTQYGNDLVDFYLTGILDAISSSSTVRDALSTANEVYLSIPAPKPTFVQFLHDNAPDAEWHNNRMRLLQLLGGSDATTTTAGGKLDLDLLGKRLDTHAELLIPETIILASLRSDDTTSLRLLVRSLGDLDTAVRYCLHGSGKGIFSPSPPSSSSFAPPVPTSSKPQPSQSTSSSAISSALSRPKLFERQKSLFRQLLAETLALPEQEEERRREQASQVLQRFGAWFDVADVLASIPSDWPVASLEAFLCAALGKLVAERRVGGVRRALAAGENLRVAVELVGALEREKPVFVAVGGVDGGEEKGRSFADSGYGSARSAGVAAVDGDADLP